MYVCGLLLSNLVLTGDTSPVRMICMTLPLTHDGSNNNDVPGSSKSINDPLLPFRGVSSYPDSSKGANTR